MGVGWALGCTSLEDITKVGPGSQHCLKKTFVLTSAKFEVFNPFAIYYTYIYIYVLSSALVAEGCFGKDNSF